VPFERKKTKQVPAEHAAERIFIATSLWKYEGWFGQLCAPTRFDYRSNVAKTRFECESLVGHLIFKDGTSLSNISL